MYLSSISFGLILMQKLGTTGRIDALIPDCTGYVDYCVGVVFGVYTGLRWLC